MPQNAALLSAGVMHFPNAAYKWMGPGDSNIKKATIECLRESFVANEIKLLKMILGNNIEVFKMDSLSKDRLEAMSVDCEFIDMPEDMWPSKHQSSIPMVQLIPDAEQLPFSVAGIAYKWNSESDLNEYCRTDLLSWINRNFNQEFWNEFVILSKKYGYDMKAIKNLRKFRKKMERMQRRIL